MLKTLMILVLALAAAIPLVGAAQPVVVIAAVDEIYTPDSSLRFAMGDCATLPADLQPYVRYISLHNISKSQRRDAARTVSFVMNSLSKRRKMYIPVFVGASNETVIRINLKDYDIDPKAWELLGKNGSGPKAFPEPYFHAYAERQEHQIVDKVTRQEVKVPTGYYVKDAAGKIVPQYRIEYTDVIEKVTSGSVKRSKEYMHAPWLDTTTIALLCKATASDFPLYRADWFIVNATIEPAYHQFLGFGEDFKGFEKMVFADDDLARKARSQDKAVVVKSSVARNNRTLTRSPTFTKNGYLWISHDTVKGIDDRNYVQNILDEKFDATEVIATLPNGLQAYFVGDGVGKRLDKADNEIATDHLAADRIVRTGRSCIYCHAPGINPIQDEVRTLNKKLQSKDQIALLVAKETDYYRIEDLFSSDLDRQIVRDQQVYVDAVGEATGWTATQNAKIYFDQWEGYTEFLLTKDVIARDCGITVTQLDEYAKLSGDPLILGLLKVPSVPCDAITGERSYQDFMILIMRAKK